MSQILNAMEYLLTDNRRKCSTHLAALWLFFISGFAWSFTPGVSVDSMATVYFTVGGTQRVIESSPTGNATVGVGNGSNTRLTIDRAVNLTVVSNDTPGAISSGNTLQVLAGQSDVVTTFSLTNAGNGTQDFILAVVNSEVSGESNADIPLASLRVFVEDGSNVGYQLLEDSQQFVDDLLPGASQTIYVVADVPASASTDDFFALTLVAQAADATYSSNLADPNNVILSDTSNQQSPVGIYETITINLADIPAASATLDTPCNAANDHNAACEIDDVFVDPAAANPEDITSSGVKTDPDLAANGQNSDSVGLLVTQSPVSVTKTQAIISGGGAHSGSVIRYTLNIDILCRTDDITNVVISDVIPGLTQFQVGSILFDGSVPANSDFTTVGGVGFDVPGDRVVANLGTQSAQASCLSPSVLITNHSLSFEVSID